MGTPRPGQQSVAAKNRKALDKWWVKVVLALALWTALGLLFATRVYLLWPDVTWTGAMRMVMPQCYVWGLCAPFIFAADRRLLGQRPPLWRILGHIPLGILFIAFAITVDFLIQREFRGAWVPAAAPFFIENTTGAAMSYALIVGASVAVTYAAHARRREQEAAQLALRSAELEAHLAEARLQVLQSQLNPHFLFNAFNTISALTETDPRTARQMMACLGKLLRASLDHAARQEVTLEEELTFLEDYLAIERLRFEDRLTVDVQVKNGVREALVPSFVLQPLVENAIRHGTGALLRSGHVNLCAGRVGERLVIAIEDDGVGLPKGWRLEDHAGVGLSNIAHRLAEIYGIEHTFLVADRAEGGVRVEVSLPFRSAAQFHPLTSPSIRREVS